MNNNTTAEVRRVLLTGGTGFIASHVLDILLEDGFHVTVTTRSAEKGESIIDSLEPKFKSAQAVTYAIVPDVASDGAFDHVLQLQPSFDYVVHTASPYHLNVQDPIKDFLDPAIKGTTGILKSVKKHAPAVKRVVITSSSAAIQNPRCHAKVYDESKWAPWTWEDALKPAHSYAASKVLSEKAAWKFVETEKPNFDLATVNNTYTFGPVQRTLTSLDAMNTSNQRIRDMVLGKMKDQLEPTAPVFTFVDVRDVAKAHVRALTVSEAGGKRFYLVGQHFTNKRIVDAIRSNFPDLVDRLPDDGVDDLPADVYQFDNSRSREVLGLEYKTLEKSVTDTVKSILEFQETNP